MAGLKGVLTTEGAVSLAAGAPKTVLQLIAAANHRVKIKRIEVTFQGISATEPQVLIDILRQSSAGTVSAATPRKWNDGDDESLSVTGGKNASAEPSAGDILKQVYAHPQFGASIEFPDEDPLIVKGGGRMGVRCTTGATPATLNCVVSVEFEE